MRITFLQAGPYKIYRHVRVKTRNLFKNTSQCNNSCLSKPVERVFTKIPFASKETALYPFKSTDTGTYRTEKDAEETTAKGNHGAYDDEDGPVADAQTRQKVSFIYG
jgi:hypothetical protein